MSEINLIMTKQHHALDGALKKKAYAFFEKLVADDTSSGLHIEPIKNAVDPRVRTGRVDLQYRAVLFRLDAENSTTYVLHGIWNHDEAIKIAEKSTLKVNPINGIPEIRELVLEPVAAVEQSAGAVAGDASAPKASEAAAPGAAAGKAPASSSWVLNATRSELVDSLGLPENIADWLLTATSEDDLSVLTTGGPEWQNLAITGLAAGMSVNEIKEELGIGQYRPAEPPAVVVSAGGVDSAPSTDLQLLDSFDSPAAEMQFARISGMEELRRVIENGDFGAWRVFLHPAQRRYVTVAAKRPYRLTGGAGTGKTVVLLHRAKHLMGLSRPRVPRILMTTFTVNLANGMQRDLQRLDPDLVQAQNLGEPGIHVKGIDSIAHRVLSGADPETLEQAVAEVLGAGRRDVSRRTGNNAWQEAIDSAGEGLPTHLQSVRFFQSEYSLVVLPNLITSAEAYVRVRRPGRGVRLNRAERAKVWAVIESYRLSARLDGTLDFPEVAAVAAHYLQLRAEQGHGYLADHVLVDEGQDMNPEQWMLVRALVAPGANDIYISEDLHQRIYGNKLVLARFGIQTRGRSRRLKLNYRTTAQNLKFAMATLACGKYQDEEAAGAGGEGDDLSTSGYRSARSGPQPLIREFGDKEAELDAAAELIRRWSEDTEEKETVAVLVRDGHQRDLVVNELGERGVTLRAVERDHPKPGLPVAMTMHRAKGMEFSKVLLFGINRASIPMSLEEYKYSEEDYDDAMLRERSLLYVAASRARDELVVSWSGEASVLLPGEDPTQ